MGGTLEILPKRGIVRPVCQAYTIPSADPGAPCLHATAPAPFVLFFTALTSHKRRQASASLSFVNSSWLTSVASQSVTRVM